MVHGCPTRSPEDAVKAFIDTRAKVMIPMHYGAYWLADDTPKEALDRLEAEWETKKVRRQEVNYYETWGNHSDGDFNYLS